MVERAGHLGSRPKRASPLDGVHQSRAARNAEVLLLGGNQIENNRHAATVPSRGLLGKPVRAWIPDLMRLPVATLNSFGQICLLKTSTPTRSEPNTLFTELQQIRVSHRHR